MHERLAELVTGERRRQVLLVVLVVTLVLGSAASSVQLSTSLEEFRGGTHESAADDYIEANLSGGAANVTQGLVIVRTTTNDSAPRAERDVLTKEQYLRQLRAERAMLSNETIARTLHPDQPPLSLANVVAIVAIRRSEGVPVEDISVEPRPPVDEQIATVRNLTAFQLKLFTSYAVGTVLDDVSHTWPPGGGFAFVPTTYEANQKTAVASAIVVSHREETDPRNLTAAQVAMGEVTNEHLGPESEAIVIGDGVVNDELRRSSTDSLRIVGPVAALLVLLLLLLAYRDVWDVLLGLLGLAMVLVWTFGYMGWANVTFNQLFVAVPVLLMGISIDYGIHVFMRHREARPKGGPRNDERRPAGAASRKDRETRSQGASRNDDPADVRSSMRSALAGVAGALALVTLTTVTGFLSNLASDVGPIREFGVVSAVGIAAALVVFGAFIPALKVEVDTWLESRGRDRRLRAFGTGGRLRTFLAVPIAAARATPWAVIALTLLVTACGIFGAMHVDNRFERDDLLVDAGDVPGWASDLPRAMQPTNYTAQDNLDYVEDQKFVYDGTLTELLVRGDVTAPDTLERVQRATDAANATDVALVLPNKNPGTRSPITMMRAVGARNETFNRTFYRADTDGDGVPDRNLEAVYDAFYEAAPDAASTMVHREDGEYVALRVKIPVDGAASETRITREVRNATAPLQGRGLTVVATGQPIENQAVATQLLDTVTTALAITLFVVLALLVYVYRRTEDSASLGVVTVLPVGFAVTWILGTMWLLSIPFNVMTALITSFTIGLGVDYSIHVTERYVQELGDGASMGEAIETAVLGTGGALLGSAVTDVVGVGVLVFAILEPLQQFGAITAITICYSFLASVVVLPSLLVVWTKRYRPETAGMSSRVSKREPMSVDD